MYNCLICSQNFDSEKELHQHIGRTEKVKLEDYYVEWYPRHSLKTGELIKFKNKDQYMTALFNSRIEMVSWLKANKDKSEETMRRLIKIRKEYKNLVIAPDTVYARTVILPPPTLVQHLGANYNNICENLGLKTPRDYSRALSFRDGVNLNIIIDKREQLPLKFPKHIKIINNSLSFGDYSTSSEHFSNLFLERKSLVDLCGSLSKGYDRLCAEFKRAQEFKANIVILVEEDLNNISSIGYTPHTKKIKAKPEFIFSRIRDILTTFPNIQFAFCKGREEAARVAVQLLLLKNNIQTVDIQYCLDLNLI